MLTSLVHTPHFDLTHDASCECLYATWYGCHEAAATQTFYESILHFVRLTHSTRLLNDGLLDQNGWKELTDWLTNDYFLRLSDEGMATIAWVLPRDREAFHDTRKLVARLERPLVGTFDDAEAAYKWLHQWPRQG